MASVQSINGLPIEILAEIFVAYSNNQFNPPLGLLSVCKLWNSIIHSTPRAWATLTIPCLSTSNNDSQLAGCIDRAGSSPLNIRLTFNQFGLLVTNLVPLLQSRRDQIHSLILADVEVWCLWHAEALFPAMNMTTLEIVPGHYLNMDTPLFTTPHLELLEFPLFLRHTVQAPQLRKLILGKCNLSVPSQDQTSVTTLELLQAKITDLTTLIHFLRRFPNVVNLVIEISYEQKTPCLLPPLVLPNLQSLEIFVHNSGDYAHDSCLPFLEAPNLTHLRLCLSKYGVQDDFPGLDWHGDIFLDLDLKSSSTPYSYLAFYHGPHRHWFPDTAPKSLYPIMHWYNAFKVGAKPLITLV